MSLRKKDWILLLLRRRSPLKRIYIMEALFFIWHRSGRKIEDYFEFEPYLYGPCSFEVYSVLEDLQMENSITQILPSIFQWIEYHLTEKGKKEANEVAKKTLPSTIKFIETISDEVSQMNLFDLLRKVHVEAPDFTGNSIFKKITER